MADTEMDRSPPLDGIEDNFDADNECAETLLQLAMSESKTSSFRSISNDGSISKSSVPTRGTAQWDQPCSERDQICSYTNDLLKHIQRDHSYFWPGDERNKPFYNVEIDMSPDTSYPGDFFEGMLGDDVEVPPRWHSDISQNRVSKKSPMRKPHNRIVSTRVKSGSPLKNHPYQSGSRTHTFKEDKYSKFQLLLKCLIANDPNGEKNVIHSDPVSENNGNHNNKAGADLCSKQSSSSQGNTQTNVCKNCNCIISHRNSDENFAQCSSELSRCHNCGLETNSQLLEKHLETEHCMVKEGVQIDEDFSKFVADDEEASLYHTDPSGQVQGTSYKSSDCEMEHPEGANTKSIDMSVLIVPCPQCGVVLSEDLLSRHMLLDHKIMKESSAHADKCSCKHSMLQTYLDGSSGTRSASASNSTPCETCVQNLSTLSERCSATLSNRSSRADLTSPLFSIHSESPVKSTSSTTMSAEETRHQVSVLEDTAQTLLSCANTRIESKNVHF